MNREDEGSFKKKIGINGHKGLENDFPKIDYY